MIGRESLKPPIGIVLTVLFLYACSASASKTPATLQPALPVDLFPTGSFDCNDEVCGSNLEGYSESYFDDGTLIVYQWGNQELTGKWYVDGDTLYTGDTWCHDIETMPASYRWQFDGEILTTYLIEDNCPD